MTKIRLAAISAESERDAPEQGNVARAVAYLEEAATAGAQICVFPEGFPGPYRGPVDFSPVEALSSAAARIGVWVVASLVEEAPDAGEGVHRLALKLIGPDGVEGTYHRVLPNPRQMCEWLMGGKAIAPGDELPVFTTELGRIGLLVCSEIWSPELALVLALRGAEILAAPIGGAVYELADRWKVVLQARASENLMYVATCQNVWGAEEAIGLVAGPERVLAESAAPGVLVADLDMARLRWLREQDQELRFPKPYRSVPGLLRHRRPELYGEISRPRDDQYDFGWYAEASPPGAP